MKIKKKYYTTLSYTSGNSAYVKNKKGCLYMSTNDYIKIPLNSDGNASNLSYDQKSKKLHLWFNTKRKT